MVAPYLFLALLAQAATTPNREVGSSACAVCHTQIFSTYSKTGMARSSGPLSLQNIIEPAEAAAAFEVSGVQCSMRPTDSGLRFDFGRADTAVGGNLALQWFVGSGQVGRNYLSARDGFLFQAPVSFYRNSGRFDAAPGYRQKAYVELTRPIGTACLQCHASRLQPIAGTENRFGSQPFLEGGVSCERCHGPGQNHVGSPKRGNIVNPAKLAGDRRDSICAQCHLTGAARVARLHPQTRAFQAGDRLSDTVAVFVRSGAAATSATNHFEQLASSACQRSAGAKLWCRTCHPVHGEAAPVNTICRNCHATPKHQPANDGNCTGCHMPRTTTQMGDHVAYTNHSIARRPAAPPAAPMGDTLLPFGTASYDERDLALAYAAAGVGQRAVALLETAAAQSPRDVAVLAQLAQLYDRAGQEDRAQLLYERVLRLDPVETAAAVNLGGYLMKKGRAAEAMALWESALRRNAGLIDVRLNLAVAHFRTGHREAAEAELKKALDWEPDHPTARRLLNEITAGR